MQAGDSYVSFQALISKMTETNEPLIVDVDLKESDLQRASFWFGLRSWSNRLMLAVMPIAGLLLLWKANFSDLLQRPLPAIGILVFLGFPPFYFAMLWFRTKRGFSGLQDFQRKIQYSFTPGGYTVRDIKSTANLDWATIISAAESKHSFHLFFHKSFFHTIPKRCFKDSDDLARMRDLLKRSLGAKATIS